MHALLRPALLALAVALAAPPPAAAGLPADDAARRDLLPAPPSAAGGSLGGVVNPAAWAAGGAGDLAFWWNDRGFQEGALDNWGVAHAGLLGFSAERRTFARPGGGRLRVHEYTLGLAHGDGRSHVGAAWRWAAGDDEELGADSGLLLGTLTRPARWLSWGTTAFASAESGRRSAVCDAAVRPLGRPWLTLFADWTLTDRQRPDDGTWSAGAEVRPLRGVQIGARLRDLAGSDEMDWRLNVGLALDRLALHVLPGFDEDGRRGATTFVVRANPPYRGLPVRRAFRAAAGRRRFEKIDLENRTVTYTRDLWFDDERVAWIDLGRRLRAIRRDPGVDGVVVNLDGARFRPSLVWELRRELAALREARKEVVVHCDRIRMGGAYVVSAADRVWIDPNGSVQLTGLALHRTYMKGLLDKLGIGFEELRFFPYKTAVQGFAREGMSPEDREQYGREVDVLYETLRGGVCAGRGVTPEAYDAIVDGPGLLRAAEARDAGLVDELGRWPDLLESLRREGIDVTAETGPDDADAFPDERWGRPPTVALVYAEGACAMDDGIRGRATSKHLRRLAGRADVAAVALRADSPGGDRLASDLVADGMRRVRANDKPVVVSQGDVAASGGYWISLEADRMLTTPLTVTGSIGVIAGWVWDEGLGGRTGFSADGVQRGAHADLFTGIRFPLIDQRLPGRPLADEEREQARTLILGMYDEFVDTVAAARGLSAERVRELGGGRVWMGEDAVERGLCDATGGLLDAVEDAAARAGLAPGDYRIEEYPPRRRFRLPRLGPALPSFGWAARADSPEEPADYGLEFVRRIARHPGEPLLLAPPEALPPAWAEW